MSANSDKNRQSNLNESFDELGENGAVPENTPSDVVSSIDADTDYTVSSTLNVDSVSDSAGDMNGEIGSITESVDTNATITSGTLEEVYAIEVARCGGTQFLDSHAKHNISQAFGRERGVNMNSTSPLNAAELELIYEFGTDKEKWPEDRSSEFLQMRDVITATPSRGHSSQGAALNDEPFDGPRAAFNNVGGVVGTAIGPLAAAISWVSYSIGNLSSISWVNAVPGWLSNSYSSGGWFHKVGMAGPAIAYLILGTQRYMGKRFSEKEFITQFGGDEAKVLEIIHRERKEVRGPVKLDTALSINGTFVNEEEILASVGNAAFLTSQTGCPQNASEAWRKMVHAKLKDMIDAIVADANAAKAAYGLSDDDVDHLKYYTDDADEYDPTKAAKLAEGISRVLEIKGMRDARDQICLSCLGAAPAWLSGAITAALGAFGLYKGREALIGRVQNGIGEDRKHIFNSAPDRRSSGGPVRAVVEITRDVTRVGKDVGGELFGKEVVEPVTAGKAPGQLVYTHIDPDSGVKTSGRPVRADLLEGMSDDLLEAQSAARAAATRVKPLEAKMSKTGLNAAEKVEYDNLSDDAERAQVKVDRINANMERIKSKLKGQAEGVEKAVAKAKEKGVMKFINWLKDRLANSGKILGCGVVTIVAIVPIITLVGVFGWGSTLVSALITAGWASAFIALVALFAAGLSAWNSFTKGG